MAIFFKKSIPDKLLNASTELYEAGAHMSSQIANKVAATFKNRPAATINNDFLDQLSKQKK